ncbi:MAG TPA: ABC transporter ATP-binding protein [Nitrospirales bacterium]|nr:ABC transporter ATP-binding protein [Nitrospirales bacterium]
MPDVRFERVAKRYGTRLVIHDLSLSVRDGEFFTLVGPSGCGKSTVLNLVAGLEPVSSGDIYFGGRQITFLSPKDRDVAMVFQSYALYPHKTVAENLAFPLQLRKRHAALIESEVCRIAGLLGLGGLLGKKPAEISGGERQRVALGRALIREPAVFLMDEPLSNLDAHLRIQTRSEIKRLHAHLKTTTLYVTHDQEEALSLSDRLAVVNAGVVQQVGTPGEIYRFPANVFVAQFIGNPRITLLPGRLHAGPAPYVEFGQARLLVTSVPGAAGPVHTGGPPRDTVVGIRPEDVLMTAGAFDPALAAVVTDVVPVGGLSWVDLRWGTHDLRALASGDSRFTPNQPVGLSFAAARLHLFDARSGERIPLQGAALTPAQ